MRAEGGGGGKFGVALLWAGRRVGAAILLETIYAQAHPVSAGLRFAFGLLRGFA
jgi:hypothetical protein